jgi:hypothetical protein
VLITHFKTWWNHFIKFSLSIVCWLLFWLFYCTCHIDISKIRLSWGFNCSERQFESSAIPLEITMQYYLFLELQYNSMKLPISQTLILLGSTLWNWHYFINCLNTHKHPNMFVFFSPLGSTGVWTRGLHPEPLHQPIFVMGFFQDRVSWSICLGWLWTKIIPISASWETRIVCMTTRASSQYVY